MKIFAIRDATDSTKKDLAFLLYYEVDKRFYIELPDNADIWETPILLSSFFKKGIFSINSYWSKVWVQQRIVPPDRQNIGQILRDNGLKYYDEYALLMLASGRCEQDDYYLAPVNESDLPAGIIQRFSKKIEDVVPLANNDLLVFFRDGTIRKCGLKKYFEENPRFSVLINKPEYFDRIQIQTGGYGIQWDDSQSISDTELYKMGNRVPLTEEDFRTFASQRIINAAEAAELLNCSRQYINKLVKTNLLHPVKASDKNTLFLKSDVLKRNWQ